VAMLAPWRKIAEPHTDIREERFDPAVFAADLGMVLRDEGPLDYRDPVTFFKKTYLTRGLSSLLLDTLRRLSGEHGGEAVVQIQTPFGGGKTHVVDASPDAPPVGTCPDCGGTVALRSRWTREECPRQDVVLPPSAGRGPRLSMSRGG